MAGQSITIRRKGQLTLPSELRQELGWNEGDTVVAVRRGNSILLERPGELLARIYGSLSDGTKSVDPPRDIQEIINEEKAAFERAVVEDVLDEIKRT
jgi:AbrB family looped-hinge helix DNA binding protein